MATREELHGGMGNVFLCACIEEHYPEKQPMRDQIAQELLACSIEVEGRGAFLEALSFEWPDRVENVELVSANEGIWHRVDLLINEVGFSIQRYPDDGKTLERWNIPYLGRLDSSQETDESANLEQLSDFCRLYHRHSWWAKSTALELWLVRQMIFAEVFAFGREINAHPSKKWLAWTWSKSLFKWLVGFAAAVTIGEQFGWPFGVVTYAIWLCCIRYLASDQINDLVRKADIYSKMRYCYVVALRQMPCPAEVRSALTLAEAARASWPEGLQTIVEAQVQKQSALWV